MKDEFSWLEKADDPRVARWAQERDREARASVKTYSDALFKRLVPYYKRPIMRSVQLTKAGVVLFLSDHRSYRVELLHDDGTRETLADSSKLGKDVVIQAAQSREDGQVVAIHQSRGGSDEGTVSLLDTESHRVEGTLRGFIGSILWTGDSYYYVRTYRKEPAPDGVAPPTDRVILRRGEEEEEVFGGGMPTNTFVGLAASHDGSKALVDTFLGFTSGRPYAGPLTRPESWAPLYRKTDSVVTNVDYAEGRHFLLSFERSCGEVLSTGPRGVRTVVKESKWPLLATAFVGRNGLLCHYLVDARSELRQFGLDGAQKGTVKFDLPGSLVGEPQMSALGDEAVVAFSSFCLPFRVLKVRGARVSTLLSEEVPGSYSIRDAHAKSADGTEIHYFTTSRRDRPRKDTLLFAYGGFRVSLAPSFNPAYLPFLEDGGTFAVANLRGGLEHGEDWHRAGMRERKFNVFEDYLAVLAKLKREGRKVVGFGRSNGGLLMGATMNANPELFAGVLIGYPVLDMMAFHRLLVGRAWVPEYGDPDRPQDAKFLIKYSPYHNVLSGRRYPPVFIYTGLKDDRVHPAHAFKFYSRLKKAGASVALRVEVESGHIGTTPEARMREEADKLAFVYETLGMKPRQNLR